MKTYKKIQLLLTILLFETSAIFAGELEDIIAKHIKAHGGAENWKQVESMKITGTFTGFSIPSDFTTIKKRPEYFRSEFGLGHFDVIQAYNGTSAWTIDPWFDISYPRLLNSAEENVIQQKAEFCTPFFDYEKKDHKVEYMGKENIEGVETFKLKLTRKNGNTENWYLNSKTYLELKVESMWTDFGGPVMQETFYDDFRKVEKIILPFYIERSFSIRNRITEIENVELNTKIEENIFTKPMSNEIAKLKPMEGEWKVVIEALSRRGWNRADSTNANINFYNENNMLHSNISYENYFKTDKQLTWSFNNESNKYVMTIFNSFNSNMMVLDGLFVNDTLSFDNKNISFASVDENTKTYQKYIITELKNDRFKIEIATSQDKGETWRFREKWHYTRRK